MGEGWPAFDVAQHPHAGHVRLELAVVLDEAGLVGLDAGLVETEIVRVGHLPDTDEQVRALQRLAGAVFLLDGDLDAVGRLRHLGGLCAKAKAHAFFFERLFQALRDFRILARNDLVSSSTTVTSLPKRRNIWPNSSPR